MTILGFNLDNYLWHCNQCWPMDCNCRLSFTGCKCSPIEVCDECLLLEGHWGEEE